MAKGKPNRPDGRKVPPFGWPDGPYRRLPAGAKRLAPGCGTDRGEGWHRRFLEWGARGQKKRGDAHKHSHTTIADALLIVTY